MNTTPHSRRSGFSLVEVLAAMAVLSVIVLIVSRLFADSSNAWDAGTRRMDSNLIARSAIEFLARELSQASADKNVRIKVDSERFGSWERNRSDELYFIGMNSVAEYRSSSPYRDVQQIRYGVITYPSGRLSLLRFVVEKEDSGHFTAYSTPGSPWWTPLLAYNPAWGNAMADNLVAFRVNLFDTNGVYQANYDSQTHGTPLYADLYLSLVDDRDATRAEGMSAGDRESYVAGKARRYSTRVYFNNRFEGMP
ncbi:MAG: prepilin-type N-terminal cleavage/methylation domain-containing protein [Kiritimatiellae bacterium]|nr:prepilin-type N-terminal cleavage/methylation domain-containing protein [Kiritimatiellia bacterium]